MKRLDLQLASRKEVLHQSDSGFSLLELLVSLTIFIVVTGSIWGVLRSAQLGRSVVNNQVELAKSVRLGLNLIGRDTYNAGFGYPLKNTVVSPDNRITTLLGIPNDFDTTRDTVPPIISGNNVTLNTYNPAPNIRTDQVTFLFQDTSFNLVGSGSNAVSTPLNILAATTLGTSTDEIVPISGSNASCRVNDIYLITGNTGSTIGLATALSGSNKVQFSNGDVLGLNLAGTTGTIRQITTPASMKRVIMVTYFVTADGILTRREFANVPPVTPAVGFVDQPLVYGVENFQIQYVMDDGTLSDNPSAGPDGIPGTADDNFANLSAIRQVRYTISVRSQELNSGGQPYRETMTGTFSTRNLGYDAS